VLFILGLSALITPLVVNVQLIRQEVPIMIGASLLLLVLGWTAACRAPTPPCCSC
jgi:cation:H+ antiporter